jgi:hypothetical protein
LTAGTNLFKTAERISSLVKKTAATFLNRNAL